MKLFSTFILLLFCGLMIFGIGATAATTEQTSSTFTPTTTTTGEYENPTDEYSNKTNTVLPLGPIPYDEHGNTTNYNTTCTLVCDNEEEMTTVSPEETTTDYPLYVQNLYFYGMWGILGLYWFLAIIIIASMFICCFPRHLKELHQISISSNAIAMDSNSYSTKKRGSKNKKRGKPSKHY